MGIMTLDGTLILRNFKPINTLTMGNTIATRIADFLKDFPPFDVCSFEELNRIAVETKVLYFEKGTAIFSEDQKPPNHFYIVKEGAVGLYRSIDQDAILVDVCDTGDVFGLRALIQNDSYAMDATSQEESILYGIDVRILREIVQNNEKVYKFLKASFTSNHKIGAINAPINSLFNTPDDADTNAAYFTEIQPVEINKTPVVCSPKHSIKEAATQMSEQRVGSIVITENKLPIGIVTDKDLRIKVATGAFDILSPITHIMSSPVQTFPESLSIAEAQIAMLSHKISHLCITEDGTPKTSVIGVLSEHDIVVLHGNNPAVFIKEIKRATSTTQLREIRKKTTVLLQNYLDKNVPIYFVSRIIATINEHITEKIIQFSEGEMTYKAPVPFTWLSLGSQGRREQLLMTDQDNALIFEDVPAEQQANVKTYFLSLATKITEKLQGVGFEYCPANMMARNPSWCLSLSDWKTQFKHWIHKPDSEAILKCTIFFDIHAIYGTKQLYQQLIDSIFIEIQKHEIFLNFLGKNALRNPPPLSFFRQFLVEQNGEHKDQFDLKSRALMPLIDAARLLCLSLQIPNSINTIHRFEQLALSEPQNKLVYNACSNAFKTLLRFRTKQGLKHLNSGRYIVLSELSKNDKLSLKNCFKPIKEIQELINVRFQLSQLSS